MVPKPTSNSGSMSIPFNLNQGYHPPIINPIHQSSSLSSKNQHIPLSLSTCANCATQTTPLWRRDEAGNTLCNACALFQKMKGRPRPISLKTDFIKQRNRSKASDKPLIPQSQSTLDPLPSPCPKRRKSSPLAATLHPSHLPHTRTLSADPHPSSLPPSNDCARAEHHLARALPPQPHPPLRPSSRLLSPPPDPANAQQHLHTRGRPRVRHPVISLPPLAQLVGARCLPEHQPSLSRGPPMSFEQSAREARYHSPPITQNAHLLLRPRTGWLEPARRAGSVMSSVSDTDSVVSGAHSPASTTQRDGPPLTPPVGARLAPITHAQQPPLSGPHEEVRRLRERVAELELINGIMQSQIGELGAPKGRKRVRGQKDRMVQDSGQEVRTVGHEWDDGNGGEDDDSFEHHQHHHHHHH